MHPPPIAERSYIEFPESADLVLTEIIDDNTKLVERITYLENSIQNLENSSNQIEDQIDVNDIWVTGIGIIAIIIAIIALLKTRKN